MPIRNQSVDAARDGAEPALDRDGGGGAHRAVCTASRTDRAISALRLSMARTILSCPRAMISFCSRVCWATAVGICEATAIAEVWPATFELEATAETICAVCAGLMEEELTDPRLSTTPKPPPLPPPVILAPPAP